MEKLIEFMKELAEQKTANPKEIADSISMGISNNDLDSLVEKLLTIGWVENPHKQMRSSQLPNYDQVTITESGINATENPPSD